MSDTTLVLSVATLILWLLAVVTPGPNFLVTARLAIARSRPAGLRAVIGIALGTVCWAAAGCFGVRTLFSPRLGCTSYSRRSARCICCSPAGGSCGQLEPQGRVEFACRRGATATLAFSAWCSDDACEPSFSDVRRKHLRYGYAESSVLRAQPFGHDADGHDLRLLVRGCRVRLRHTVPRGRLSKSAPMDRLCCGSMPYGLRRQIGRRTVISECIVGGPELSQLRDGLSSRDNSMANSNPSDRQRLGRSASAASKLCLGKPGLGARGRASREWAPLFDCGFGAFR
jgi:hypothetical protein